jgi:hypothetical protein
MIFSRHLYDESTHVRIVADLEFDQVSSVSILEAGLHACHQWGRYRLLLHLPTLGAIDLLSKVILGFGMADAYERIVKDASLRVRVAALGNNRLVTDVRPVEAEFIARGLPFRTFDNEPEALTWLLKDQ